MSVDRMLAGHLQDVVTGQTETTQAVHEVVRAVREAPPPNVRMDVAPIVINVPNPIIENKAPDQPAPTVNVTVPVPVVHVTPPEVTVQVPPAPAQRWRVTVTARDEYGLIREFILEPFAP